MRTLVAIILSLFLCVAQAITPEEVGEADVLNMSPCMYGRVEATCIVAVLNGVFYGITVDKHGIVEILELPSLKSVWKRKTQT